MRSALGAALAVCALTLLGGAALAAPTQMTWTDAGFLGATTGTFTAAAPLCSSGTFKDTGGTIGIKMEHTCADGSGTFEFEAVGTSGFHFNGAGTGRYATLRGSGSCSVTQNDDGTFTRSCHALADFDNTAPSARISNVAVLIAKPSGLSRIAATLTTSDNVQGNAVSYRFSATAAGRALGHVSGSTSGGSVKASLRVRLPRRARRVTLSLKVSDPLHNVRTVTRSQRLRR
jgi:hypothetical protein